MARPADPGQTQILDALQFAAAKHRTQKRKDRDRTPYLNHVVTVAHVLSQAGVSDVSTLVAALLHDTIEDTDTTATEIENLFGKEVCDLVLEMTDDMSLPPKERKRLQVEHAPHLSPKARLIKLADKTANLEDLIQLPPMDWSDDRKREYANWSESVVQHLRGTNVALEARYDHALKECRR